ncbi:hypothetical protein BS47DRAFT_1302003, partial [Hydnum rufescens UP504]
QIEHFLQAAEAIRRDGRPEWMQVVGLTHNPGQLLSFSGPTLFRYRFSNLSCRVLSLCQFDERVIFHETFAANLEQLMESTLYILLLPISITRMLTFTSNKAGCGLDNGMLSWGHGEYQYHAFRGQGSLSEEGLAMIRYHSFYPWHREGACIHLMDSRDYKHLEAVRAFNPYTQPPFRP